MSDLINRLRDYASKRKGELADLVNEAADALEKMQLSGEDSTFDATSDLISRQAAIDALYHVDEYNGRSVEAIRNLPSAQPETSKRIVGKSRDGMTLWYQCDMCNEPVDAQDNFCRGCGRRLTDG